MIKREDLNKITFGMLAVSLFLLVSLGMPTLSELVKREAEIQNIKQKIIATDQSLLENLHVYKEASNSGSENLCIVLDEKNKACHITLIADKDLFIKKMTLESQFECLKVKIFDGLNAKNHCLGKVKNKDKEPEIGFFESQSSHSLLAPLIFFTALSGAVLQFLRVNNKDSNKKNGTSKDIIGSILMHLVNGLGIGILCTLLFTVGSNSSIINNEIATDGFFSFFSKYGIPSKVLLSFLAGMFMNEIYSGLQHAFSKGYNSILSKFQ